MNALGSATPDASSTVTPVEVLERLRAFGGNSNSFLMLYGGFRYFSAHSTGALIGFIETPTAWVAATEPLGPESAWEASFRELAENARAQGKGVLVLPLGVSGMRAAEKAGFGSLMIGTEPKFDFESYQPSPDAVQTARAFAHKGATVQEFKPGESKGIQRQCEEITQEWLGSRQMAPLDFLNRVAPWEQGEHKKYFLVEFEGQIRAFLAAVPIFSRNGWYLIDVLRRSQSPAGSTELLMLEAMRLLKAQGAKEVSLGVSPLSNLHLADRARHPFLYRVLSFTFEHTNLFYRFKPLYEFKLKFHPSRWEPAYVAYYPDRLGLRAARGLIWAMVPSGLVGATLSFVPRFLHRFDFNVFLRKQLSASIISRSTPASVAETLRRSLGTLTLAVLSSTSVTSLSPISRVALFFLVAVYGSLLEWLGGSFLVFLCFGIPVLVTQNFTAGFMALAGGLSGFLRIPPALVITALAAWASPLIGTIQGFLIDICFHWILGLLWVRFQLGEFRPLRFLSRRPL